MAKKTEVKENKSEKFIAKLEANLNGFDYFTDDDKKELLEYLKSL
jgi:hypothetical protein